MNQPEEKKINQPEKTTKKTTKIFCAKAINLDISPRKFNLVAELVRKNKKKMNAEQILNLLQLCNKKASGLLFKVVSSAIANAVNNFSQNPGLLFVEDVMVYKAFVLKRVFPRARGQANQHKLRYCSVRVTLALKEKKKNNIKEI